LQFSWDVDLTLSEFVRRGLSVSPWLITQDATARFGLDVYHWLDTSARELAAKLVDQRELVHLLGNEHFADRVPRIAIYEIAASTSVALAFEQLGVPDVRMEHAQAAMEKLLKFCSDFGFWRLIELYCVVTSYENQQAVAFYGSMPERDFVSGRLHRPWVDYSLADELAIAVDHGIYALRASDSGNEVVLTETGHRRLEETRLALLRAGYHEHRVKQLQLAQLSAFSDYAQSAAETWANMAELRQDLIRFSGIGSGMHVLELGCGDGALTFDAGLAERVLPHGRVTAIDPARGMLNRATIRQQQVGVSWVDFVLAHAERLPFADHSFDAAIGSAFLHFVKLDEALAEIRRVLKPGRLFASLHPAYEGSLPPLAELVMEPIVKVMRQHQVRPRDNVKRPDEIVAAYTSAGFQIEVVDTVSLVNSLKDPVKFVRHYVCGVGWAQEELSELPWKARIDVVRAALDQSEAAVQSVPMEQRELRMPLQRVLARA